MRGGRRNKDYQQLKSPPQQTAKPSSHHNHSTSANDDPRNASHTSTYSHNQQHFIGHNPNSNSHGHYMNMQPTESLRSSSLQSLPDTLLTAKPHAFCGSILTPKHARELTPQSVLHITHTLAIQALESAAAAQQQSTTPTNAAAHDGSGDGKGGGLASPLSADSEGPAESQDPNVQYTVWITEAWRDLGWAEPSAALFWEMATMYYTLHVAGRSIEVEELELPPAPKNPKMGEEGEELEEYQNMGIQRTLSQSIPPILSCGSSASMDSAEERKRADASPSSPRKSEHVKTTTKANPTSNKASNAAAKELPVWLLGMFLLLHCEDLAFHRNVSGEDERRFDALLVRQGGGNIGTADWKNKFGLDNMNLFMNPSLSPRAQIHAGNAMDNSHCTVYLLRHLRKFLLLSALPSNADAIHAIETLSAPIQSEYDRSQPQNSKPSQLRQLQQEPWDLDAILERHDAEHESIGLDVLLGKEDVERLNLILQAPKGGLIDDPPLWISELLPSVDEMQVYGGLSLEEVEREIRRHLETELWKEDIGLKDDADETKEGPDGLGKEMKNLTLNDGDETDTSGRLNMNKVINAQGGNTKMHKELTYSKIRGTTILLKPNPNNKVRTMAASNSHTQNSNDAGSTNESSHAHATTGAELAHVTNGRLHDIHVSDCSDAHIYLLQPFEHATLSGCTGCTIVVGAVAGLLYVVDCERTNITSAARRVLVSNCFDVTHSIFTPSPPLLVGDNRRCQFAPYNTYYDGLREDLLATGLAAAVLSPDNVVIGDSVHGPALQCASNKWKQPSELSKLSDLLHPTIPQRQKSSGSISDEKALSKTGGGEDTMHAPTLVPASEFQVLFVPLESEANRNRRLAEEAREEEMTVHTAGSEENSIASANTHGTHGTHRGGGIGSNYSHNLADVLQLSPFRLPTEFERRALVKADRMKSLQQAIQTDLTQEQQMKLEEELNRGFRDWLVTSGNLRQVLDLVHLESKEAV